MKLVSKAALALTVGVATATTASAAEWQKPTLLKPAQSLIGFL